MQNRRKSSVSPQAGDNHEIPAIGSHTHIILQFTRHTRINQDAWQVGGTGGGREAGSGLGLEEMIAFQADVHECSTRLYRLSYTEGNRRMLAELRRRLS